MKRCQKYLLVRASIDKRWAKPVTKSSIQDHELSVKRSIRIWKHPLRLIASFQLANRAQFRIAKERINRLVFVPRVCFRISLSLSSLLAAKSRSQRFERTSTVSEIGQDRLSSQPLCCHGNIWAANGHSKKSPFPAGKNGLCQSSGQSRQTSPLKSAMPSNCVSLSSRVALLHKSADGRSFPFPGRTHPTVSVIGMPSAVKPFKTATRTWNSAT